jgi:hypothetical protein
MKKLATLLIFGLGLSMTSCYYRIGDLTMISNRNVDSKTDYKMLKQYVIATAKSKKGDPLENALDNAVKKVPGGEFMKNTKIYVKVNGKKIKVEGDIWGIPVPSTTGTVQTNVTKSVEATIQFKVGDTVSFKSLPFGKIVEGTILGLNSETAIVSQKLANGKEKKLELSYEKLTKIKH